MEENDDSFIIDVKRLMEEFEKFLSSLPNASDKNKNENISSVSDEYLDSLISELFPGFQRDIKPLLESLKWAKKTLISSNKYTENLEDLTLYEVFSIFLTSIYKVKIKSTAVKTSSENIRICLPCWLKLLTIKAKCFWIKKKRILIQ